jgi:Asp-tRNA(Asn)/Glu-tRNA(Gln) amidotransferase A subunit family amidase
MTDFTVSEATIAEIHAAMRRGRITSEELVDRYIKRIERYDQAGPELTGIVTIHPDVHVEARARDATFAEDGPAGPLPGVPVLVKDQVKTAGLRTTFGSEAFSEYIPEEDAAIVEHVRSAGGVVLAKTNLLNWAASGFGYSSAHSETKTRTRSPGIRVGPVPVQPLAWPRTSAPSGSARTPAGRSGCPPPVITCSGSALRRA